MKQYESIKKRVQAYEYKRGINYAKVDGKLFKTLKIFYTLLFIYTLGINLLYILSLLMRYVGTEDFPSYYNSLMTVGISTGVLIVGFVFLCTRFKAVGSAISIVPLPFILFNFAVLTEDISGILGYKAFFYWRHFCPIVLMFVFALWMLIIALRATLKFNSRYKKITENLYIMYHNDIADVAVKGVSDEQWEEFLQNYDTKKPIVAEPDKNENI